MTEEEKELKPLSKKHQKFLAEYLKNPNATQAARDAGYKDNEFLHTNAAKLLQNTTIKSAIDANLMTVEEAMQRLTGMGRADLGDYLNDFGGIDLSAAREAGITKYIKKLSTKTVTINGKQEDKEIHTEQIELYSAHDAVKDVLKIHGKYKDNVDVTNSDGSLKPETMKPSEIAERVAALLKARDAK